MKNPFNAAVCGWCDSSTISVVKKNSDNNCNNLRAENQHYEMNCLLINKKDWHLTSPYKMNTLLSSQVLRIKKIVK